MRTTLFSILLLSFSFAKAQSIQDLDFLIGTWKVHETIYPGTEKEYTEEGTRTCEYYLKGSFIKCESTTTVSRNGKERAYTYVINYDKKADCFRATNLAHDFHLMGQFMWFLDKENEQLIAVTPVNVIEDRFFRGTISYADPDRLDWNGYASIWKQDKDWVHIFNDVSTKVD